MFMYRFSLRWCLTTLLAAFLLGACFLANGAAAAALSDTDGHWAEKSINTWVDAGLIQGYGDHTFKPDNNISRAELMALINRAFGFTEKAAVTFTDITAADWYDDEVAKAVQAGYITGYNDQTVKPDSPVSRQEMAVIAARLLDAQLLDLSEPAVKNSGDSFSDAASIPDWSRESINAVVARGYLSGYPDGTFKPDNATTRAETVTILARATGELYNQAGVYGPDSGKDKITANVTVAADGITLQNLTIEGDLLLTPGLGDGTAHLKNVTVAGRTMVAGGGEKSIICADAALDQVVINKTDGKVKLVLKGCSSAARLTFKSGGKLEVAGENVEVTELDVATGDTVEFAGNCCAVNIKRENAGVHLAGGTINTLNIEPGATEARITGKAKIKYAFVSANATLQPQPDKTYVQLGTTANVAGKDLVGDLTAAQMQNAKNKAKETNSGTSSGGRSGGGSGGGGGGSGAVPVEAVVIVQTDQALNVGDTVQLSVTITPANATNQKVTWKSSDTSVATVDANGKVTAAGAGTAVITATSAADSSKEDSITVTVSAASAATVTSAAQFKAALENNNISSITLGADIDGSVTAIRTGANSFSIIFGSYVLHGNLSITANSVTAISFGGSAYPAVTGNLTVAAANATITNGINVGGTITISDVGNSTWVEQVDGNKITLTDPNGATIIIYGNPEDIIVDEGADGISITANSPVTITVSSGATVNNITVGSTAAGTTITNNGTVNNVTANADIDLENNNGEINIEGSGTVGVSGAAADEVKGTAKVVAGISAQLGIDRTELRTGDTARITGVTFDAGAGEYLNLASANPGIISVNQPGGLAVTAVSCGKTAITVQVLDAAGTVIKQGVITLQVLPESIAAASVTMTAPATGAIPQTAAEIESATSHSDYTVTAVTWNEALSEGGKFKAGQVYTASVVLISKHGKAFQQEPFTPSVTGAASVGKTTTTGTNTGNRVTFTVAFPATGQQVSPVNASPAPGEVTGGTTVTLSTTTEGATIYYTLDGSTPTASSAVYTFPITINANTTIKAIGVKAGMDDSAVATFVYTIRQSPGDTGSIAVSAISIDQEDQLLEEGTTLQLTAVISPANATNKRVNWASSDETVVTVDNNGLVTATGKGTAAITATAEDGNKTDTITITVPVVAEDAASLKAAVKESADDGDTIVLRAGKYVLDETLVITKSIRILGPQANVDPRPSKNSPRTDDYNEAVLTGDQGDGGDYTAQEQAKAAGWLASIFEIRANDVVINGLTLERTYNHIIYSQTADPAGGDDRDYDITGLQILNNIVRHGRGNEGIKIGRSINALVQYNYVHDILHPGDAIEAYDVKRFSILDNEIDGCSSVNGNIRVSNRAGGEPGIVRGNIIKNTGYHFAINAEDGSGNMIIDNNIIENAKAGGIFVYKNRSNSEDTPTLIEITNNIISNYATDPVKGTDYRETYLREAASAIAVSYNLREGIQPVVTIAGNTTRAGAEGKPVLAFGGGTSDAQAMPTDLSRFTVSGNTFDKLFVKYIKVSNTNELDLLDNTWPRLEEQKVYNLMQGSVHAAIQDAVNSANDGDTILVGPGQYNENLAVDKPLALLGAGRDVTIVQAVQGRNYNGGDMQSPVVMITGEDELDGITISGFTFRGHIPEANPGNPNGPFDGWGNTGLNGLSTHGILSFDMNSVWPPPARKNITVTNNKFVYCGGVDLYNVTGFEISNNIMVRESHQIPYYVGDARYHDKANGGVIGYLSNCRNGLIQNNAGYSPKDTGVISIARGSNINVVGNCVEAENLPRDNGYSCAGIRVWYQSADIEVSGNTVKGFRDDPEKTYFYGAAVLIENSACEVTGNVLEDNDYGIMVKDIDGEQTPAVTGNTISGCATGVLLTETCGETGPQISGNTFAGHHVHVQDNRVLKPANYLEGVLENNTFPEGSQVVGNTIKTS